MTDAIRIDRQRVAVRIGDAADSGLLIDDIFHTFRRRQPERKRIEDVGIVLIEQTHRSRNAAQRLHEDVVWTNHFQRRVRPRLRRERHLRRGYRHKLLAVN